MRKLDLHKFPTINDRHVGIHFGWGLNQYFRSNQQPEWIKQHLRIKSFYGTSENAVKTQIWIAISVYVLIAIIRKRLKVDISLYTFLQILSLTLFEKGDILQLVRDTDYKIDPTHNSNQLNLFDF